jgi:hypothetical protein
LIWWLTAGWVRKNCFAVFGEIERLRQGYEYFQLVQVHMAHLGYGIFWMKNGGEYSGNNLQLVLLVKIAGKRCNITLSESILP